MREELQNFEKSFAGFDKRIAALDELHRRHEKELEPLRRAHAKAIAYQDEVSRELDYLRRQVGQFDAGAVDMTPEELLQATTRVRWLTREIEVAAQNTKSAKRALDERALQLMKERKVPLRELISDWREGSRRAEEQIQLLYNIYGSAVAG